MNEHAENWFIRFIKRIGIIKEYEVSKEDMCKMAKNACDHNCSSCAWNGDMNE